MLHNAVTKAVSCS